MYYRVLCDKFELNLTLKSYKNNLENKEQKSGYNNTFRTEKIAKSGNTMFIASIFMEMIKHKNIH